MAQSDLDRSHAATPYKLEKARDRGQVAKSPDVTSAIVFVAAMVFLTWRGGAAWREQLRFDQALLTRAALAPDGGAAVAALLNALVRDTMNILAPFFLTLVIAAIVANLLQTGAVLSAEPLKPDWDRLNPVSGVKRLFSLRTLFLAARALLKLSLLGVVAYFALKSLVPQFFALASLSPSGFVMTMLDDFSSLGMKLASILVLIAVLDLMYVRREFAKNMRMSRRELKDESKNRDGDPRIRARLRQLRREMLKRSLSLSKTRTADVLITNPTHVAVALRYVHGEMNSPQLVSKGLGFMAAAMRLIAAQHRIPVVQSPTLARALYKDLGINDHVHPALFSQVARIIVWVFSRREAMRGTRRGATAGGKTSRSPTWAS